jgi:hypothetical protein
MPNWCNNNVTISHADSTKLEALAAAVREGKFLNHVIPVPEDLQIVAGRVGADDNPDQIELERREQENLKKYGVKPTKATILRLRTVSYRSALIVRGARQLVSTKH